MQPGPQIPISDPCQDNDQPNRQKAGLPCRETLANCGGVFLVRHARYSVGTSINVRIQRSGLYHLSGCGSVIAARRRTQGAAQRRIVVNRRLLQTVGAVVAGSIPVALAEEKVYVARGYVKSNPFFFCTKTVNCTQNGTFLLFFIGCPHGIGPLRRALQIWVIF